MTQQTHRNKYNKTIISWHLVMMMLRNGKHIDEVSAVFGLQRHTVNRRAKAELPISDFMDYKALVQLDRRKKRHISWPYVFKLLHAGESVAVIAKDMDMARETLKKRARDELTAEEFELYTKLVMKNRFSHKLPPCGTVNRYWLHRGLKEKPIDRECLDAYNEYNRGKYDQRQARYAKLREARLAEENKLESDQEL